MVWQNISRKFLITNKQMNVATMSKIMALFSYLLIFTYGTVMSLKAASQEPHSEAISGLLYSLNPADFVREGSFSTDSLDVANRSLFYHILCWGYCYLHVADAGVRMMLWWYTVIEGPMFKARCGLGM